MSGTICVIFILNQIFFVKCTLKSYRPLYNQPMKFILYSLVQLLPRISIQISKVAVRNIQKIKYSNLLDQEILYR